MAVAGALLTAAVLGDIVSLASIRLRPDLATPVLAITLTLITVERVLKIGFSIPRWAVIRCCSSTCSGSIRTPPCTS